MSKVEIIGVVSTDALRRGERAEVERTERVERLLSYGYVKVAGEGDREQPISKPSASRAAKPSEVIAEVPEPEEQPESKPTEAEPPARNASRDDWAGFLDSRGIGYPADAKRDDLRDIWDGQ